MATAFVIQKIGWQYNDEVYFREGDEGTPERVFINKDRAKDHCRHKNIEALRKWGYLGIFGYSIGDISGDNSKEDVQEQLKEITGETYNIDDWDEMVLPDGLNDEQIQKILDLLPSLRFYELVEVEIEE